MWADRFEPSDLAVHVKVTLSGPITRREARFIVDTGSQHTIVDPVVTDELGYGAHMGTRVVRYHGSAGEITGYKLAVQRIEAMGLVVEGFEVTCEDLHPELGIAGLIGMDFLRGHVLTVDCIDGRVTLAP